MIKIAEMSDLHLEFGGLQTPLPEADYLFLAGDVCVGAHLHDSMNDAQARSHKKAVAKLFQEAVEKYKKIFYICGNHEFYRGNMDNVPLIIQNFLEKTLGKTFHEKVVFMDKTASTMEDGDRVIRVLGCTLWSDFLGGNPVSMEAARNEMNDYNLIYHDREDKLGYNKITPDFILGLHREHLTWLKEQLNSFPGMDTVVMSHHAPTFQSIHPTYKGRTLVNGAYATELTELILEHLNIIKWFHGHVHHTFRYTVGSAEVSCNPRGYYGMELNPDFNSQSVMEI